MPRRRVKADEELLDAAMDIVRRHGPASLTFAALSASVGLAPATLVQRFGTKADLLHATLSRAWDLLEAETSAADLAAAPDAGGAVDFLVRLSGTHEQRDYPDQLLVLREDLRDPVLRRRGQAWLATVTQALDRRLGD
jgi:AcrR family transcriptional regulator